MKTYEVRITAYCSAVVRAENEEEAMGLACDAADMGDFEMDEAQVRQELKTPEQVECYIRHANVRCLS